MKHLLQILAIFLLYFLPSCSQNEQDVPQPAKAAKNSQSVASIPPIIISPFVNYGFNPNTCSTDTLGVRGNLSNLLITQMGLQQPGNPFLQIPNSQSLNFVSVADGVVPNASYAVQKRIDDFRDIVTLRLNNYLDDMQLHINAGQPFDASGFPVLLFMILEQESYFAFGPNANTAGLTPTEVASLSNVWPVMQAMRGVITDVAVGDVSCTDYNRTAFTKGSILAQRGFFSRIFKAVRVAVKLAVYSVAGALVGSAVGFITCGPPCVLVGAGAGAISGFITALVDVKNGICLGGVPC